VPVTAILGIGCYTSAVSEQVEATCRDLDVNLKVVHRTEWFFS
jgi:hypothetical protein